MQHQTESPTDRSSINTCPSIKYLLKSQKYFEQSYNMTKQIILWKHERKRKACLVTYDINDIIILLFYMSKVLRKKNQEKHINVIGMKQK